jgi:hypothetical protein
MNFATTIKTKITQFNTAVTSKINISARAVTVIKIVLAALVFVYFVFNNSSEPDAYVTGDSVEYYLITEAIVNHGTPNVTLEDCETFKTAYSKRDNWDNLTRKEYFDATAQFIQKPSLKFFDVSPEGLFVAKNGKCYGYHFVTMSYMHAPMRAVYKLLGLNPINSPITANALFIALTVLFVLLVGKYNFFVQCMNACMFLFSASYFYHKWPNPEVLIMCLVACGLWAYFHNKKYIGIFLVSLATTQAQTLIFIPFLLCVNVLYENKFSIITLVKTSFSAVIVFVAPLFFYVNFGMLSIIAEQGYLSWIPVNFTRVFGFFFDVNQGLILSIPLTLIVYLVLWIINIKQIISKQVKFSLMLMLPIFTMLTVLSSCTMILWLNGNIIHRYATYVSIIILIQCVYMLGNLHIKQIFKTGLLCMLVLTQFLTTRYHVGLVNFVSDYNVNKPLASWLLHNYPHLYNPDPQIITSKIYNPYFNSDLKYTTLVTNDSNEICKILTDRAHFYELKTMGFTDVQIASLKENAVYLSNEKQVRTSLFYNRDTVYHYSYCYINRHELLKYVSEQNFTKIETKYAEKYYLMKVQNLLNAYRNNTTIIEAEQKKAAEWKVPYDVALLIDACYALGNPLPKEARAKLKIDTVIHFYLESINKKSKERNKPVGDVVLMDADYLLNI